MIPFILWYLLITILGWLAFPLVYRLLPALADRGYAFSRILGLLVWGFVFWLLASLGVIKNDPGGLILGLVVLGGLSVWALKSSSIETIRSWLRDNRSTVLSIEILFLATFAIWAFVRSANPEILGTEKPMELAFINSIIRSPQFPPHDPWLSGYAISYYYFGYVMTAMIAKLTSIPGSVAFNLMLSQTFALVSIAAYGLLYSMFNVLRSGKKKNTPEQKTQNLFLSLLGPTFILLVSNLEGALEVLHARGFLWSRDGAGQLASNFWIWLDMKELSQPPAAPLSWAPSRYLWWWRASRVVQDYDLAGTWREVIDEFPFFSYLLGDLHPHVLVMPFALLAIGISLNLYLGGARGKTRWLWIDLGINFQTFWAAAVIIGGLAFLNTWDFPMYVVLFSLVYTAYRLLSERQEISIAPESPEISAENQSSFVQNTSIVRLIKEFLSIAFPLTVTGILLYLPFYVGFSSQAGGILPNLVYSTRGIHLWVMFGSLLLPIFAYLLFARLRFKDRFKLGRGFIIAGSLILILWVLSLGFGLGIANIPLLGDIFVSSIGGGSNFDLIAESLSRRVSGLVLVTMLLLLALAFGYLYNLVRPGKHSEDNSSNDTSPDHVPDPRLTNSIKPSAHDFALILILMGGLLVLFVEFFYLRDQFGSRMNTIFKFYFQTWIFWGLAAAFGTGVLLRSLRGIWNILFRIGFGLLLLASLTYPFFSLWTKTNGFNPPFGYTLDGTAYLERSAPDEMAGIRWLEEQPDGVVVEAVGPQYSEYARVATISGQPNVLGWAGHESQWRGGRKEIGTREEDIEAIFSANDWERTKLLLDMYDVRYIFIGPLERRTYRVNEAKFERFLGAPVFQTGQVTIYEIPRES